MSDNRRVHREVDKLPKELIKALQAMCVDNEWPEDHQGKRPGKPYYQDMADYAQQKGHKISVGIIGRFCRSLRTYERMKQSSKLVEQVMNNIDDDRISANQKAAAEMLTAVIIEQITGENVSFTPKELKCFTQATKDCTKVVISAEKYIQEKLKEKVKTTADEINTIGENEQISPETLKKIREQVYGILDYHPA